MDPPRLRTCWFVPGELDLGSMQKAAILITGEHDFASFESAGAQRSTSIRHVIDLQIVPEIVHNLPGLEIAITANGFLYNMVRNIVGTLIRGFRRAAFPNEAGLASAAIAHSAARTSEPVREGLVALLEPFIDTVVVCTTTALVIVVTGAYADPEAGTGITMTASAFATVFPDFPKVLTVIAVLFAFSTMISWSYYGERSWKFLFGARSILVYQVLFLAFTFGGVVFRNATVVLDFGDLMILGMAFPNIAGVVLLAPLVKADLDDYMARLASGSFARY